MKGIFLSFSIALLAIACGSSDSTPTPQMEASTDETEVMQTVQESNTLDSINQEILESSEVLDALLKEIN